MVQCKSTKLPYLAETKEVYESFINLGVELEMRDGANTASTLTNITLKNHTEVLMDVTSGADATNAGNGVDVINLEFAGDCERRALVKAFRWLADRIEANS